MGCYRDYNLVYYLGISDFDISEMIQSLSVFLLSLSVCYCSNTLKLSFSDDNNFVIENGYTRAEFSGDKRSLISLFADFSGSGDFKTNVLSAPFSLEVVLSKNVTMNQCSKVPRYKVLTETDDLIEVEISGISEQDEDAIVEESWVVSLKRDWRFLDIGIAGSVLRSASVVSISHGVYTGASSLYGLFDRGVVQMMGNNGACLGSSESIG